MSTRAPQRPPQSRSRRAGSAVLPACLGFVAGAVFWHFVGFWDFVGRVVLANPAQYAGQQASENPAQREPDVLMVAGPNATARCARLTLDRGDGHTRLASCDPGADQAGSTLGETLPRVDLSTSIILPDAGMPAPLGGSAAGPGAGN